MNQVKITQVTKVFRNEGTEGMEIKQIKIECAGMGVVWGDTLGQAIKRFDDRMKS